MPGSGSRSWPATSTSSGSRLAALARSFTIARARRTAARIFGVMGWSIASLRTASSKACWPAGTTPATPPLWRPSVEMAGSSRFRLTPAPSRRNSIDGAPKASAIDPYSPRPPWRFLSKTTTCRLRISCRNTLVFMSEDLPVPTSPMLQVFTPSMTPSLYSSNGSRRTTDWPIRFCPVIRPEWAMARRVVNRLSASAWRVVVQPPAGRRSYQPARSSQRLRSGGSRRSIIGA